MPRSTRAKERSRSGTIPVKSGPSSDSAASEPARGGNAAEASVLRFKGIDVALLALLLGFALLLWVRHKIGPPALFSA